MQDSMRLDGKGNYTVLSLTDASKFLSSRSLGVYETLFPKSFFRVHKGFIINLDFLCTLIDEKHKVVRIDGKEVAISRRRWSDVKSWLS